MQLMVVGRWGMEFEMEVVVVEVVVVVPSPNPAKKSPPSSQEWHKPSLTCSPQTQRVLHRVHTTVPCTLHPVVLQTWAEEEEEDEEEEEEEEEEDADDVGVGRSGAQGGGVMGTVVPSFIFSLPKAMKKTVRGSGDESEDESEDDDVDGRVGVNVVSGGNPPPQWTWVGCMTKMSCRLSGMASQRQGSGRPWGELGTQREGR
jgi:hypothetical protein